MEIVDWNDEWRLSTKWLASLLLQLAMSRQLKAILHVKTTRRRKTIFLGERYYVTFALCRRKYGCLSVVRNVVAPYQKG